MTVVDLHPEELLDRDARGELTAAERERLERHLSQCEGCRLERQVRSDFRGEQGPHMGDFDVQRLLSEVLAPGAERELPRPRPVVRSKAPLRMRAAVLIAAAVLVASVSALAGWTEIRSFVSTHTARLTTEGVATDSVTKTRAQVQDRSPADEGVAPLPGVASTLVDAVPVPSVPARVPTLVHVSPVAVPPTVARAPESSHGTREPQPEDASALFAKANGARRAGDHERAAGLYRALMSRYPDSPEAKESGAALGRLLLGDGDPAEALHYFEDYLRIGGPLEEDVVADRAMAFDKLGRSTDEAAAWTLLLKKYPGSVHAAKAEARLRELRRAP